MVNFKHNAGIVLSTLERYRYGPRIMALTRKCFDDVSGSMDKEDETRFSLERLLDWCDSSVPKGIKQAYKTAIYRLADVYAYGKVLGCHITVYVHPSENYQMVINGYLGKISKDKNYTPYHLKNIRHCVNRFCCFAQYNGAGSPDSISYEILDAYDTFLRESSPKAYYINEGLVVGLLEYMAENGLVPVGYSIYMHYLEFGRATYLSALSASALKKIESSQKLCTGMSAGDFFDTIDGFKKELESFGYSSSVLETVPYHLTMLFLFLDRKGLKYDRTTVELWQQEVGEKVFRKGFPAARRTYEMYDDYICDGSITPSRWWKHKDTKFDLLPPWCREQIILFLEAKKKEGWKKSTIKMYLNCATSFCGFLVSSGLFSFREITPALVKEYNAYDIRHKTPEAKNAYNSRVRRFLIFLEIHSIVPAGLHFALPHSAVNRETIIEVLSDTDKDVIEKYCQKAETPLQLRDAAMLMILTDTGLRSCDVTGLKLTDIDWKQKCIRIIQKKTRVEHIHPISVKTGNQIYRYITGGRQKNSGFKELFLKLRAPFGPVGRAVCRNAMERAGASTGRTHLARKSFASDTLNRGASFVETAELLGHSDTSNVHKYTQLDADHMKLCPLSLAETGLSLEGRYRHG